MSDWDPMELFPLAPDDEYDSEINSIIRFLEIYEREIEKYILGNYIYGVYSNSFDGNFTRSLDECIKKADKIIDIMSI